jgi:hypothetical protein
LRVGGASTTAGKHEALSCRMSFPAVYTTSAWKGCLQGEEQEVRDV